MRRGRENVSAVVYVDGDEGEVEVEFEGTVWSGEDLEVHTATPPEYLSMYLDSKAGVRDGDRAVGLDWFAAVVDQELWDKYRDMREDSEGDWAEVFQGDRD